MDYNHAWSVDTCYNIEEPQAQSTKQKKAYTHKKPIWSRDSIYRRRQNLKTDQWQAGGGGGKQRLTTNRHKEILEREMSKLIVVAVAQFYKFPGNWLSTMDELYDTKIPQKVN
jgi:hypothetical protein